MKVDGTFLVLMHCSSHEFGIPSCSLAFESVLVNIIEMLYFLIGIGRRFGNYYCYFDGAIII